MNEKKKTLLLMLIIVIAAMIFLVTKLLTERGTTSDESVKKGELALSSNIVEEFTDFTPSDDLIEADDAYYEKRKYHVTISDPEDLLSENNFLPIKAHFIRNEEIAKYLDQQGYQCDEVEIATDPAPYKKDHNSIFYCILPGYDNVLLKCTWHGITEDFKFEFISKEETTVS